MKGLANALLIASAQAFRGATPVEKLTTPGFLQYLLGNNKPAIISESIDDGSGYNRSVKIRYRKRGIPGRSVTEDNCTVQVKPAYATLDVPAPAYRAFGLCFSNDEIATFEKDALAQVGIGNPQFTKIMQDMWGAIVEQANGLFQDINNDLLALQNAAWGKHVASGSNAARTINFPLDGTVNNLATGMTQVVADAMLNEMKMSGSIIVGAGLITNYYIQQVAKSADSAGLNTAQLVLPKFYYDPGATVGWGADRFGLFEKDAVQFINQCNFRGSKAGQHGADFFMTLKLPLVDSLGQGSLGAFEFDVQIMFRSCPEEVIIGDADPVLLGRGYNIILSTRYGTVNIPTDSYEATDRLYQCNGTYRYLATNA